MTELTPSIIRLLRAGLDEPQVAFAQRIGTSRSNWSIIEIGLRPLNPALANRVVKAYDLDEHILELAKELDRLLQAKKEAAKRG